MARGPVRRRRKPPQRPEQEAFRAGMDRTDGTGGARSGCGRRDTGEYPRGTVPVRVGQDVPDATRTRTRARVVARHRRGGHAVVVGRAHGHDGDGLRPAPGRADLRGRGGTAAHRAVHRGTPRLVHPPRLAVPSPSARSSEPSPSPSTARPSRTPSSAPAEPPATAKAVTASGEVKGYRTKGGRVVFELGKSSAKLVSATPEPGWSMQVWTNDAWIRVDFSDGAGEREDVLRLLHLERDPADGAGRRALSPSAPKCQRSSKTDGGARATAWPPRR